MTVFASHEEAMQASPEDMRAAQEYAAHMVPLINADRAASSCFVVATHQRMVLAVINAAKIGRERQQFSRQIKTK